MLVCWHGVLPGFLGKGRLGHLRGLLTIGIANMTIRLLDKLILSVDLVIET